MALFKQVVEAFIASRELDQATLSRLAFWTDGLGEKEFATITTNEIDAALVKLAERGRLLGGKTATTHTKTGGPDMGTCPGIELQSSKND